MNKKIIKIFVYVALTSILCNLHHPVTPTFISKLGIGRWIFGPMLSMMALGSMVSSRIWGVLWDRNKSRLWMILPYGLFYSLAQFGLSQSTTAGSILTFRVLSGPFAAGLLCTLLPALIAHESKSGEITKNQMFYVGLISLFSPMGYLIGGYLGVIIGAKYTIVTQSILVLASIIPGFLLLSNGHVTTEKDRSFKESNPSILSCVCANLGRFKIYHFLALMIPFFIMRTPAGKFFDVLLISEGFNTALLGKNVMVIGIFSTISMFVISPRLSKRFNSVSLMAWLLTINAVLFIVGGLSRNVYVFIVLFAISIIFTQIIQSLVSSFLLKRFPHRKGEVMGLRKMFTDFGMIVGPFLLGFVFTSHKWFTFTLIGIILIPPALSLLMLKKWILQNVGEEH